MAGGEEQYIDFELFHPRDSRRHQVMRFNLGIGSERSLYTVLPEEICQKLGQPLGTFMQFISAEGISSEVELWAVGVRYKDRQCITPVTPSKNEKTILGFLTLVQLGLTHNLTQIRYRDDQIFYSLIYDMFDILESLYNTEEALDVYREVVRQYNEDWIDIFKNVFDNLYRSDQWRRSSFVVWFFSIYHYSLNTAIISLYFGLYPYVAVALRLAFESLIVAYVVDTHEDYTEIIDIHDQICRWYNAFEELEKSGFRNFVNKYLGNDENLVDEISSLWKDLSGFFIHAKGLLFKFPTFQEVSSIAVGLPMGYVDGDKEPLTKLNNCVKKFRKIFKKMFDKWSATWLKKNVNDTYNALS
jgi:hypothetical protein